MELEKRQRSKEQQQSRSYSFNPFRALGHWRTYSQEPRKINVDNMNERTWKGSLKLIQILFSSLLNFQASGGVNGTIDVYLKWRYTYLPASAKPRAAPQVCTSSSTVDCPRRYLQPFYKLCRKRKKNNIIPQNGLTGKASREQLVAQKLGKHLRDGISPSLHHQIRWLVHIWVYMGLWPGLWSRQLNILRVYRRRTSVAP